MLVAMLIVGSSLTGLLAWFSWQDRQGRHTTTRNNLYIEVGKQAALNLTTISYRDVDAQVQRILASSTGSFHDDFQQRATPFVDVVKKAQSQSIGTVTAAGLESVDGDQARVLVAVSVTTTIGTGPQQDPRGWRMRIDVTRDGQEGIKVSNVEFVP
ncbi:mammalian cell entry protein [Mycolicibacterium sp. HS_4_1]